MKRALTVLLVALAVSVLLTPTFAAYTYNWYTGFEPPKYTTGPLANTPVHTLGQDGWFLADNPSYVDEVPMDVVAGAGRNGSAGVVQRNGHSAAARDMTVLNYGATYQWGRAKFWVYDPGYDPAQGLVDARVGIYGAQGENNIGKMATAQIQDVSSRDPNYWWAQWSYSVGKMDGATPIAGQPGFTFTQGLAAPRVWGAWSYVMLTWAFTYTVPHNPGSGGTGVINWFVNQQSVSPNLTLNFDSSTTRWGNFHEVKGIFMGTGMTTASNSRPAAYDDFEFYITPEPSGLLALGGGLIGLLGLIRRRR